ncbi:hypothetical protein EYD45_11965 [Hyunsoonleella flava]|uniref:Uncharacterized protein n=1 Tax=Hyunsoonleella flava TaxID=2527939 RepID=A0A4Q9FF53_9FLAO|nr:DUF6503 family protein [Hyunsoonleella flava]TBN02418.1 hypothetical protein EYD45_11965 [Hyunsoonleella flava]
MKHFLILFISCVTLSGFSQELTGSQLLEKAIAYHDPNSTWNTFKGKLFITMEIPKKPNRDSEIVIDLPNEFFSVKSKVNDTISEYTINKDSITIVFNGDRNPTEDVLKEQRLSKKRAKLYQNYYTYLYGLPMKLKDPGTIIHNEVITKTFKGKTYWVLKATYKDDVGNDIWYFYFDKDTYAMEVYQFFHDESKNDGEYILLSEEEVINGIKMPKIRAWYMNKDNKYLGTDILKSKR